MSEDLSKLFPDGLESIVEQTPSALRLRLEALAAEAARLIHRQSLGEVELTEMIQSVYTPAQNLFHFLGDKTAPQKGWTLQVSYLEQRFDRKYRGKARSKKGS